MIWHLWNFQGYYIWMKVMCIRISKRIWASCQQMTSYTKVTKTEIKNLISILVFTIYYHMITVQDAEAIEYLAKIHKKCIKSGYDIDLIKAFPCWKKVKWTLWSTWKIITSQEYWSTLVREEDKQWKITHKQKKLSEEPNLISAKYHDYMRFISKKKWSWLPN